MEELLIMSKKEIDRYNVLQKVRDGLITQRTACNLIGLKERQVRNLMARLKKHGPKGLISKHRGKPSNHCKSKELKQSVMALLRERYEGYGPTLAQEKLQEWEGIQLSVETIRLWMMEYHLWISRKKNKVIHKTRQRRKCFGELIQADGSHHRWLGEDQPLINLTVFIDDATGKLTALVFSKGETLESYFQALEQHLNRYGRPYALYTDKFSIFQYTSKDKSGKTQMQRVLKELDVELILANSPQAKGRVERANRTLQDRLAKEIKFRGIKTIEEANEFAKEFIEIYNDKFSKEPMNSINVHRPLDGHDLGKVLCRCEERTLSSSLTFQFNKNIYQVQEIPNVRRLKGRKIEVRVCKNNEIRAYLNDKELKVLPLSQIESSPVMSRKELLSWKPKEGKPSATHPWKRYAYQMALSKEIKRYEAYMI